MFAVVSRHRHSRRSTGLGWAGLVRLLAIVPAILILAACSSGAPSGPAGSNAAKPAATKPASSAASTAKPSASPGAVAKASPSPQRGPVLSIVDATLADSTPWVIIRLSEGEPQIISGWKLEVADKSVEIPGNAIVQPGETLTLQAGTGQSSDRIIFLGQESQALALSAAPGARVRLVKPTGEVAAETTVPRY